MKALVTCSSAMPAFSGKARQPDRPLLVHAGHGPASLAGSLIKYRWGGSEVVRGAGQRVGRGEGGPAHSAARRAARHTCERRPWSREPMRCSAAMVTATRTACGAWPTFGAPADVSWDSNRYSEAPQCPERPTSESSALLSAPRCYSCNQINNRVCRTATVKS